MQIRPTKALINLDNLANNYRKISSRADGKEVIAVVKADAYGHGAIKIVEKLNTLEHPPVMYAVATVEEVIDLRETFPGISILIFEPFNRRFIDELRQYNITATLSSIEQLVELQELDPQGKIDFHIKIDTGMGRLGVKHYEVYQLVEELKKIKTLSIKGIYTHFATSDEDDASYTSLQIERFEKVLRTLKAAGISTGIVHSANSGGIFDHPSTHYDAVRAGISLYGYYKNRERSITEGLKPLMSLKSEIGTIRRFLAGENVSYGLRYTTAIDTNIASIPVGYADGVRRALQNRISIQIGGKTYPQAGTITMDRIMVDLGDDHHPPGTEVVLLSDDFTSGCDGWYWCKVLDTIPYEVTCGISSRVPRIYTEGSDGFC